MPLTTTSHDCCAQVQALLDRSALLRERSEAIAQKMAELAAQVNLQRQSHQQLKIPRRSSRIV
jgi:hypothetical protein